MFQSIRRLFGQGSESKLPPTGHANVIVRPESGTTGPVLPFQMPNLDLLAGGAVTTTEIVTMEVNIRGAVAENGCAVECSDPTGKVVHRGDAVVYHVDKPTDNEAIGSPRSSWVSVFTKAMGEWIKNFNRKIESIDFALPGFLTYVDRRPSELACAAIRYEERDKNNLNKQIDPSWGEYSRLEQYFNESAAARAARRGYVTSSGLLFRVSENSFETGDLDKISELMPKVALARNRLTGDAPTAGQTRGSFAMQIEDITLSKKALNCLAIQAVEIDPQTRDCKRRPKAEGQMGQDIFENLDPQERAWAERCFKGYRIGDYVFRTVFYKAPPPTADFGIQEQNDRFAQIMAEAAERYGGGQKLEFFKAQRVRGPHFKSKSPQVPGQPPSYLYRSMQVWKVTDESKLSCDIPEAPPLRPALTTWEVVADGAWQQQRPMVQGLVTNYGEVLVNLEMYLDPAGDPGGTSFEEQEEEWLRRKCYMMKGQIAMGRDVEILESSETFGEGAYLDATRNIYERNNLLRLRIKNFKPEMATPVVLPGVTTTGEVRAHTYMTEHQRAHEGYYYGDQGYSFTYTQSTFPFSTERNVRQWHHDHYMRVLDVMNRNKGKYQIAGIDRIRRWITQSKEDMNPTFDYGLSVRWTAWRDEDWKAAA